MNVFVSRPTYISDEHKSGLGNFLKLLNTHGMTPRTLGATDYPNKSPLDEVISILEECRGAIILGYPQIEIQNAKIKGEIVKSSKDKTIALATEWNHIEASLAYARGIPLLVTHHTNVQRGIFDRGTLNSFIYEVDFTQPDWCMKEEIFNAILGWKLRIENGVADKSETTDAVSDKGFIEQYGVLWKSDGMNIESIVYCPKCKTAMHVFPPHSNEMVICNCGYIAPFTPKEMKEYQIQLNSRY